VNNEHHVSLLTGNGKLITRAGIDMAELNLPSTVNRAVVKNANWNFGVNLLDITFFTLGLSLVARDTVMPVLVSHLTASKFAIGLIPAIFSLCFYLPQLLIANFSERLRYKKPFTLWLGGLGERGGYLLIGLSIWLFAKTAPTLALVLFFVFLALSAMSSGTATPAWFDMIAKVIPVNRRGLWSGLSHSLGALMGIVGALFVGRILETHAYPNNFALLFFVTYGLLMISFVGLALNREPPSERVKEPVSLARYFRQLPEILRRDHNYLRFLLSRTTVQLGAMATGFFMVYGTERFHIDGAGVGLLTAVLVGSSAVMNLVWGFVGDRLGHKLVLVCAAFAIMLAALSAWLAVSQTWLILTFILVGVYAAGDGVSGFNIILEFCAPEDRPTYIGLTSTLLAPMLTVAPLIGGWLAVTVGYSGLFLTALAIGSLGFLFMLFWVREPRVKA
jgi:MFS family permease